MRLYNIKTYSDLVTILNKFNKELKFIKIFLYNYLMFKRLRMKSEIVSISFRSRLCSSRLAHDRRRFLKFTVARDRSTCKHLRGWAWSHRLNCGLI